MVHPDTVKATDTVLICDSIDKENETVMYEGLAEASGIIYKLL